MRIDAAGKGVDWDLVERARQLAGLKGYVTNLPAKTKDGHAVIAAYHDLWQVEKSFRMAKSDLRARPIFHHKREAIEAHLTVVFAALAVSRHLQTPPAPRSRTSCTPCRPSVPPPSASTATRSPSTPTSPPPPRPSSNDYRREVTKQRHESGPIAARSTSA